MTKTRTQALRDLAADMDNARYGSTAYTAPNGMRKNAHDQIMFILENYPETEPATEWGAGFVLSGNFYNHHHSREDAEAYIKDMASVGARMMVMTREYTPAYATAWKPVDELD